MRILMLENSGVVDSALGLTQTIARETLDEVDPDEQLDIHTVASVAEAIVYLKVSDSVDVIAIGKDIDIPSTELGAELTRLSQAIAASNPTTWIKLGLDRDWTSIFRLAGIYCIQSAFPTWVRVRAHYSRYGD